MNFLIVDLEATCWSGAPPNDIQEIIEIGVVMLDEYGEERSSFNQFVRPLVNERISVFCQELTGIEQEQVLRAQTFPNVIDLFLDWSEIGIDDHLLVTWGGKDIHLLQNDCILHDLDYEWISPHLNLKTAYRHLKSLKKPIGLKKCIDWEGFEFEGRHHRAIDDAINTVKIFRKYLDEWQY